MLQTVPLSIVTSSSLYTQQWYMSYRFADSLRARSGLNSVSKPVWHIPLLCVQWRTPDDGQRNCPKHVEFYSENKFEKTLHLVGFIIRIYQDARSPERQNLFSVTCTWIYLSVLLASLLLLLCCVSYLIVGQDKSILCKKETWLANESSGNHTNFRLHQLLCTYLYCCTVHFVESL